MAPVRRSVIVGHGAWGRILLAEVLRNESFDVQAVVSPSIHRATAVPATARRYISLADAVAQESFDVAFIAVPPQSSFSVVSAALEGNLDTFAEKPIALSTVDAVALHNTALARQRVLYVDYVYRCHSQVEALLTDQSSAERHLQIVLSVTDRRPVLDWNSVLWLWGPHLCALVQLLAFHRGDCSNGVLQDAWIEVMEDESFITLRLLTTRAALGALHYCRIASDKARTLKVGGGNSPLTIDLLRAPIPDNPSPLARSVRLFAKSIDLRESGGFAFHSVWLDCVSVTRVLEQASKG